MNSKRFRPRFSVRTLAIFVTLVCVYFGAWEVTKRCGVSAVEKHVHDPVFIGQYGEEVGVTIAGSWYYYDAPNSPVPFVVTVQQYDGANIVVDANGERDQSLASPHVRKTYLWLFGIIYPRETYSLPATHS